MSQSKQPELTIPISYVGNPYIEKQTRLNYTFKGRQALTPAHCNATLSKPQKELVYNINSSFKQDLNRTKHRSQNQNQNFTIDRQISSTAKHDSDNATNSTQQTLIISIKSS